MAIQNLILGMSIYMLFYDHLPHWGSWFNRILKALPQPLQTLYDYWRCPYCVGFWIGLVLHAVTGSWLFDAFAALPAGLDWIADALAFAVLNKAGVIVVNAVSYPALLAMEKKDAFFAKQAEAEAQETA